MSHLALELGDLSQVLFNGYLSKDHRNITTSFNWTLQFKPLSPPVQHCLFGLPEA